MMVLVAVAALNFATIRALLGFHSPEGELLVLGALPMANILAAGLLIGRRYHGSRRFLLGFEAFGAIALASCAAGAILFPDKVVRSYLNLALDPYWNAFLPNLTTAIILGLYAIALVMLSLPQLAFAVLGGFLSHQFRTPER